MAEYSREQIAAAIERARADGNVDAVDELTAKIADIDRNVMIQSQQTRLDEMSTTDWLRETAKNASTQGLAFSSAVGQKILDVAQVPGLSPSGKGFFEIFEENNATAQQILQDYGIFQPNEYSRAELREADPLAGYGTAAVEATADPMGYLGTKVYKAAPMVANTLDNVLSGLASEFGYNVGTDLGGEEVGMVTSLIGGTVGPAVTAPGRDKAISIVGQKATDIFSHYFKDPGGTQFEEKLANKSAVQLLKSVEKGAEIDKIISDFEKIRPIVGDDGLPTFVALSENPDMLDQFVKLARTNSDARSKLNAELDALLTKMDNHADELFGNRNITPVGQQVNPKVKAEATAAERARVAIDNRLLTLSDGLPRVSSDGLGAQVQGLITAKAEAVRTAMSKEYEALANEARKAGVYLPAKGTAAIYDFVVQNNVRDIFGKTTQVDKDIMSILSPKVTKAEPSKIAIPPGARTAPTEAPKPTRTFAPMSFDKLDSLKRAINKQLRETKDPAAVAKLNQLKTVVDEQRKLLPENWNQRLIDLDTQFYERVGVPINNKAMQDIESREYAEKVAPILLNNVTAAKTFVDTIGADAVPILKSTLLSKLHDVSVRDGMINTNLLKNNIRKYREIIDLVPGLRDEMGRLAADNATEWNALEAAKDEVARTSKNLKTAEKLTADTDLGLRFSDLARNLDKPDKYEAWTNKIAGLDQASQNLLNDRMRREVLAQATQGANAMEFLTDPNKTPVMSRLFGPDYVEQVQAVGRLNDMLAKMDPNKIKFNPDKDAMDPLKAKVGVSAPQTFSVLRDRIASPVQKVAILLSKTNEKRVQDAKDRKMLALMLDPDVIGQLSRLVDSSGKPKFSAGETVQRYFNIVGQRIVGLGVATGGRESARPETERQLEMMYQ